MNMSETDEDLIRGLFDVGGRKLFLEAMGVGNPTIILDSGFGLPSAVLNMRSFAHLYPDEVAGLVLVDATHEDIDARVLAALPPATVGEDEALTHYRSEFQVSVTQKPEYIDWSTTKTQLNNAGALSDIPLVVITAGRNELVPPDFPEQLKARLTRIWFDLQLVQLRLSPHSSHIIAEYSGHAIPRDQPNLVVDAVRQVVTEAQLDLGLSLSSIPYCDAATHAPASKQWVRALPQDFLPDEDTDARIPSWQRSGAPPLKVVIGGPFNAGKSQFVQTISEIAVVSTERRVTDGVRLIERGSKEHTTVAMDFGRMRLDGERVLHLYGTPGQKRFDFMWAALARGMKGLVILVDSTSPATFRSAREIMDFFHAYRETPYVVVANKQDLASAWKPEELRLALRVPAEVKVLPCVATNRESVRRVLAELLDVLSAVATAA
jgi:uncharacterized protein